MKRLWIVLISLLIMLISACDTPVQVQNNVLPTLVSVTAPLSLEESDLVVLQGRYFGDGLTGEAENSYVRLGADIAGQGGVLVRALEWSPSRIVVRAPDGAGSGYAFVYVRGVRSNGLPANLP